MLKDIGIFSIAQLIITLRGILLLPILAIGLSTRDLGIWSQITITATFLLPILYLSADQAIVRYLPAMQGTPEFGRSFWSITWGIVLICVVWIVAVLVLQDPLGELIFSESGVGQLTILFGLVAASRVLSDYFLTYLRAVKRTALLAVLRIISELATIIGVSVIVLVMHGTIESALIYWVIVQAVFVAVIIPDVLRQAGFHFVLDFSVIRRFVIYGAPLTVSALLVWVLNSSDRYFVTHQFGLAVVGIYAAAYNLSTIASFTMVPINTVLLPMIAQKWDVGERDEAENISNYLIKIYTLFTLPLVIGITITAPYIMKLAVNTQLPEASLLLFTITFASFISGMGQFFQNALMLQERTRLLAKILVPTALFVIVAEAILIAWLGLVGAGIATLLVMILKVALLYYYGSRGFTFKFDWGWMVRVVVSVLLMGGIVALVDTALPQLHLLIRITLLALVGLGSYVVCTLALGVVDRRTVQEIRQLLGRRAALKLKATR